MLQLCIFLLVVGVLALILELIMPGYDGFIGAVVGVMALVASAILAVMFVPNGWVFVGISGTVLAVCAVIAHSYIRRQQLHGRIVLSESLSDDPPQMDYSSLVGKEGRAVTQLRPSGEVDFNGTRLEVTTGGNLLDPGTKVKVLEAQNSRILVAAVNSN